MESFLFVQIHSNLSLAPRVVLQVAQEERTIVMGRGAAKAFQKVKDVFSSPLTIISPINDLL